MEFSYCNGSPYSYVSVTLKYYYNRVARWRGGVVGVRVYNSIYSWRYSRRTRCYPRLGGKCVVIGAAVHPNDVWRWIIAGESGNVAPRPPANSCNIGGRDEWNSYSIAVNPVIIVAPSPDCPGPGSRIIIIILYHTAVAATSVVVVRTRWYRFSRLPYNRNSAYFFFIFFFHDYLIYPKSDLIVIILLLLSSFNVTE